MKIDAWNLVHEIEREADVSSTLLVYWVAVSGDRDQLAREVLGARGHAPIVPWVMRSAGFDEPNSIGVDVSQLLESARPEIQDLHEAALATRRLSVVVLSRRELGLSVSSSPILLPGWFPLEGGLTVTARIRDLTWSVRVPVSDGVSSVSDMQRLLYELDGLMLDRVIQRALEDGRLVRGLWDRMDKDKEMMAGLALLETGRNQTINPSAFRPSSRGGTLVGGLWRHVSSTSPDRLVRSANALRDALGVSGSGTHEPMPFLGVVSRPSNAIADPDVRWSFSLLLSIRSACQFVTAAAHADEYGRFPTALLRSTSLDIREFLDAACGRLRE